MRIFRYLGKHMGAVLLALLLLLGQAFCDLMLPNYTSQIVDVGIQQAGVEHVAADELSTGTYASVAATDAAGFDAQLFADSYELDAAAGTYRLTAYGEEHRVQLDAMMALPLATVHGLAAPDLSDDMVGQAGIAAARAEYEVLGRDVGALQMQYLFITGLKMMGFVLLSVVIATLTCLVAARTGATIGRELRTALYEKVMSFSDAEVQRFSAASLITRATNDVQQIQMMCILLLRMVLYAPILGIGGIIMVARTDLSMGWVIGLAIVVVAVVVLSLMMLAMPKFKIMQKLVDRVNLVSRERLTGVSVVRAFGQQLHEQQRFDDASSDLMRTQLFTNRVMTFMMPSMFLIMNLLSVVIVWVGAGQVDAGVLQTGDLIAFITYSMMIMLGFVMLSMLAIIAPRADVSASRIDEVLEAEISIRDPEIPADAHAIQGRPSAGGGVRSSSLARGSGSLPFSAAESLTPSPAEGRPPLPVEEESPSGVLEKSPQQCSEMGAEITFDHVTFAYDDDSEPVLHDIMFTAEAGKTCAIIGPTGSGKSTILKLVERFYDVGSGAVRIDGIDVRDLPLHELRAQLGYVPQRSFLFSGTIESNVGYGEGALDEARIREAIEIAQATELVEAKEEGLQAEITQGGTNVSGGQRQRLAIARALATDARALLFDDSFSALDYKTDAALRRALAERMGGKTQVIVAQRIATVMGADKIIVLDEGRIVGQGTHAELLRACEQYREIAHSQLSPEELGEEFSIPAEGGEA